MCDDTAPYYQILVSILSVLRLQIKKDAIEAEQVKCLLNNITL